MTDRRADLTPNVADTFPDRNISDTKHQNDHDILREAVQDGTTPFISALRPEAYGAKGDGSNETGALQACLDAAKAVASPSGPVLVWLTKNYATETLTYTGSGLIIAGPGGLTQFATGYRVLDLSSSEDCTVDSITITGLATANATPTSANDGIYASGASNLRVTRSKFYNLLYDAISIVGGEDIQALGNYINQCCYGIQFAGGTLGFRIAGNILRDPIAALAQFIHGIAFQTGTPCEKGEITGNRLVNYQNSQNILVHSGRRFVIHDNLWDNALVGCALNIYTGASDVCEDMDVHDNIYIGTSTTGLTTVEGNQGIQVASSNATALVTRAKIHHNTIINANAFLSDATGAGIILGHGNIVQVNDNAIDGAYGAGIRFVAAVSTAEVKNNTITNVRIASNSQQFGIHTAATGVTGVIEHNTVDGGSAGLQAAIRGDASNPGLYLGKNHTLGTITNPLKNAQDFASYAAVLQANPPVSGTAYLNNTTRPVHINLAYYATTPGTPGSVQVSIGPTSTPGAEIFTVQVAGSTTSVAAQPVTFRVPQGWFWSVTPGGVTAATAMNYALTE